MPEWPIFSILLLWKTILRNSYGFVVFVGHLGRLAEVHALITYSNISITLSGNGVSRVSATHCIEFNKR